MGLNIKYCVRPINENMVIDSIFETYNLFDAIQKAELHNSQTKEKCIIVSIHDELKIKGRQKFE
jgi:hypothetical protein